MHPNPDSVKHLANVNGTLFFAGDDGTHGLELWKSDGTPAGTSLVKDIMPGMYPSEPLGLQNVNGMLLFAAWDRASERYAIWKSDGTEAGTKVVQTFRHSTSPIMLRSVGGLLFFFDPPETGLDGFALWRTDGTTAGTVKLVDLYGTGAAPGFYDAFVGVNGQLFFVVERNGSFELWKSDGSVNGTLLVVDNWTGEPRQFVELNKTLFFTAQNNAAAGVWKSDGTASGTTLVFSGAASGLTVVNGSLYFASGNALWKSDGTPAGTMPVKDNFPSAVNHIASANGTIFFSLDYTCELWKSDGTGRGTVLVKDLIPNNACNGRLRTVQSQGILFISAYDHLWKSDGTADGTSALQVFGGDLYNLTVAGDDLFFNIPGTATSPMGDELWSLPIRQVATSTQGTFSPTTSGSLVYTTGQNTTTSVAVPANAVTEPTTLLYQAVPSVSSPANLRFAQHAFTLDAFQGGVELSHFSFQQPISISIEYTDSEVTGLDESSLRLYYKDGTNWIDAATSCSPTSQYTRDHANNRLTVDVCHLTEFAVFGAPGSFVFLPFVMR